MTYCETCDNVTADSRKRLEYQWLCIRFPRMEGGGFVAPTTRTAWEPYMRCDHINGGACPLWKPIRNGQQLMNLAGAAK